MRQPEIYTATGAERFTNILNRLRFSTNESFGLTNGTKPENMQGNKTGIAAAGSLHSRSFPMRSFVEDLTSAAVIIGFISVALSVSAAFAG